MQRLENIIEIPIIEKTFEVPDCPRYPNFRDLGDFSGLTGGASRDVVEVLVVGPPLRTESAPPMFVTAPVDEASLVAVWCVQLAPVIEYVSQAAMVVHAAPVTTMTAAAPVLATELQMTYGALPTTYGAVPVLSLNGRPKWFVISQSLALDGAILHWSPQTRKTDGTLTQKTSPACHTEERKVS